MPTKTTETTSALTDAVVNSAKLGQELALSGLNAWVDVAGKALSLPKVESFPFADVLPNAREVVEASFGFAEELLATQKEFAIKVVDAVSPK
jgi:hypothetical protein